MAESSNSPQQMLAGKAAIVTGAAGGIGAAIATLFARSGAWVLALDLDPAAITRALGGSVDSIATRRCDVTLAEDAQAAVDAAVAQFGGLDILVNAAASDEPRGTICDLDPTTWDLGFAVNVKGAYLLSRAAVPVMAKAGGGSIIHIASQLGSVATAARPLYCATKGALIQLAKAMAIDHAPDHIRVNTLSPGAVATTRLARRYGDMETASAALAGHHLLKRLAQPEEIAEGALFLASDRSSFMTGADLLIDGGYNAT